MRTYPKIFETDHIPLHEPNYTKNIYLTAGVMCSTILIVLFVVIELIKKLWEMG